MKTKKVSPAYGVWLYLAKVIFEDLVFMIGYLTLKILTLWRFPKNIATAQKIDILIFLVAFVVIIGIYFMVFIR